MHKFFKSPIGIVLGFALGMLLVFAIAGNTAGLPENMRGLVPTTFENCEPNTQVGGVRWVWKDDIKGNYDGSDTEDVPEIALDGVGSQVVLLPPGDYAITHYRPSYAVEVDGGYLVYPSAILDFREITVEGPETHSFGCEG